MSSCHLISGLALFVYFMICCIFSPFFSTFGEMRKRREEESGRNGQKRGRMRNGKVGVGREEEGGLGGSRKVGGRRLPHWPFLY